MSPKRRRRQFTVEQKAAILRRHFVDKVPVSDVCDEHGIQPSMFFRWRQQLFDNLDEALRAVLPQRKPAHERKLEARVAALEAKLARKDAVIAEISEEYVQLKKELGEP